MYIKEFDVEVPNRHLFLGENQGVALVPRGPNDNHIKVVLLVGDDGYWFVTKNEVVSFSSYWIKDLVEQLQAAKHWMAENAIRDPSGYGYCFTDCF